MHPNGGRSICRESGGGEGRVCRQAGDRRAVGRMLGIGSQGEFRSWRQADGWLGCGVGLTINSQEGQPMCECQTTNT